MNNLAAEEPFQRIKARLSDVLDAWMETEGDPGAPLDTPEAYYPRSVKKLRQSQKKTRRSPARK